MCLAEEEQQMVRQCDPREFLQWYLETKKINLSSISKSEDQHIAKDEMRGLLKVKLVYFQSI